VFCGNGKTFTGRGPDRRRWRQVGGARSTSTTRRASPATWCIAPWSTRRTSPTTCKWNAASIWVGPNCHLVHYPLRGGEQYNVVVTFHSRGKEEWGVTEGSKEEVQSYFQGICPKARQLIDLPKSWKRWATADREPIAPMDLRPRHAAGRRRPPDHAIHGAGRLHGAGRCGDAGRSAARATKTGPRRSTSTSTRASRAPPASCCRAAKWAASTTPRAWSAWCATPVERPHARALLRRDGMAVWLERRQLSGRLGPASDSKGLTSARRLSAGARWPPPCCRNLGIRGCRS
jgi:hypothetical protein